MNHHKKTLRKLLLICACWLTAASALDTDKYAVMHVASESATYDRNQNTITYLGHVQGDQGSSKVDGDKMVVYKMPDSGSKIRQVVIYGNPAHYSTLPSANKSRVYVEALKITYDPEKKTVLLEEHGRVNQDGNIFSGPHIWYDMNNEIVHSLAVPGKERTEMIIQPQQNSPPKK
jgi:lipopolysaccharide export system protein LptA